MPLLNYTTTVAVEKTVAEIQAMLVRASAKSLRIDYDGQGQPVAITFLAATPYGDRSFRLPADTEAVWRVLVRQQRAGTIAPRFVTKHQAARIGWRIVKDWIAAQLAIIETEMVTFTQVMLPYMQDSAGITVYERMEQTQLLLSPGKEEQP